jgi:hypothetical protein
MKLRYYFIIFILFISCKSNDKSLFEFDPSSLKENEITLSVMSDDIKYIPLDNIIPLTGVNAAYNPIFVNKCIYYYERSIGIVVFDSNGQFLRKIGCKGRGSGEYLYGSNFTVDGRTSTTYIYDLNNLLKIYSKNGVFRNSISLREYGGSIDNVEIFNSKLFISFNLQYDDDYKYEWIIIDTLGNAVKKKQRTLPVFKSNYLHGGGTYVFNHKLNYWNQFIDTVFSFLPDFSVEPNLIIKPGEYRLPKEYVNDALKMLPNYFIINQILETNKYLIIRYSFYRGKNGLVIIDKKKKESFLTYWKFDNYGSIINDLDGGVNSLPINYMVDNGKEYLIELIDSYQLKAHIRSDKFISEVPKYPEKKKEFEKLASGLKDTDNPVLMLVRLKQ